MASTRNPVKSIFIALVCAAPGLAWFAKTGATQALVIACLGGFVGFCLSLPEVSASRVAGGTAAMIIGRNLPMHMQDGVWDYFVGDDPQRMTPDEIVQGIIQYANSNGIDELPDTGKQIALIVDAESAADFGDLPAFVQELPEHHLALMHDRYRRMGATDISSELDAMSRTGDASRLSQLISDRTGYDFESVCDLLKQP